MVTVEEIVNPGEANRVVFINLNALCTQIAQMPLAKGLIVGCIAKAVKQRPDDNALSDALGQ